MSAEAGTEVSMIKRCYHWMNASKIYYTICIVGLLLVFTFCGERGFLIWKDSEAYLACDGRTGIMPVYPLLIYLNKILFGETVYLYALVAEQTVLTVVCIMLFAEYIRKTFFLSFFMAYPVVLLSAFMPFTVNYPLSLSNHDIMTEALAYPLFYLYIICFLETIFTKRYRMVVVTVVASSGLALLRTQLQLCVVFSAAAFFYVAWMRGRHYAIKRQIYRGIVLILASVCIILAGEAITLLANAAGQSLIHMINSIPRETEEGKDLSTGEKNEKETDITNVTDQYSHLVIDKAVYEIDEEDYLLFEDEELQKLCQAIYKAADESGGRYVYARKNLWAWEDIMNGIAGGTATAGKGWGLYLEESPDTHLDYSAVNHISSVLLKAHLGRIVLHTFQMMPQGFICTVFFQKEKIYLLCHLITMFLYISALGMVVWGYRTREIPRMYAEFLLGCIVVNLFFVLILCVMFFAMQRYLVYCFGIFYVAYYLMVVQVIKYYWTGKKKLFWALASDRKAVCDERRK